MIAFPNSMNSPGNVSDAPMDKQDSVITLALLQFFLNDIANTLLYCIRLFVLVCVY